MESQHSVGWPTSHDFPRFLIISEKSRPEGEVVEDDRPKCLFGKKFPYGQIFQNVFRTYWCGHRTTSCVQISWNLADRKLANSCVIYRTKKTKLPFAFPLSLLRESRPKSVRVSFRQYTRSAPKFHPNPYTSGGVVAGRVNIVETLHKVFPILGEASSPSKKAVYAFDICPSLSYIVNKAICAPAAIKSHVLLSSAISCICLAYIIVRLQHVKTTHGTARWVAQALRCVAAPDPVWTRLKDFFSVGLSND